jgi:hypothetical protein
MVRKVRWATLESVMTKKEVGIEKGHLLVLLD